MCGTAIVSSEESDAIVNFFLKNRKSGNRRKSEIGNRKSEFFFFFFSHYYVEHSMQCAAETARNHRYFCKLTSRRCGKFIRTIHFGCA